MSVLPCPWVPLAMKHDILFDSVTVGRLGTNGVLLAPYGVPNLVEQPWERKRYVNLLAHAELTDVDLSINKNSDDVNLLCAPHCRSAQIVGPEFSDQTAQHGRTGLFRYGWNVKVFEMM